MDSVAPPDRRGELMLPRPPLDRFEQPVHVLDEEVGGAGELDREASVEHVRAGHPLVEEARLRPDMLGDVGEEGDHVVLHLRFDRIDPLDLERAPLPHGGGGFLGDDPKLGHRVHRVGLDLEPDPEAGLGRPDAGHLRPRIAGDHGRVLSGGGAGALAKSVRASNATGAGTGVLGLRSCGGAI